MKTFRQFIYEQAILLEERLDKIKDLFRDKIDTSHDTTAEHQKSDDIINHFANHADPTAKKTNTQWIVNKYRQKQFRQEDHPRIKEALSNFEKYKGKLKEAGKPTDINQYKSLSDVEDVVEPHIGKVSSGKEKKRQIKSEGADLIHSGNGVTIHHIKNEQAACAYGANTKWCTAGKENNMFNHYNKYGPIHVIQHQGRKYQFHTTSKQFMDEKDNPVEMKNIHPDIQKEMAKSDHPEIQKANILFKNPHISKEHITKALDDEDSDVRYAAIRHPNVIPEHITKALDDDDWGVRQAAIEHPNVTPEHITKALDDEHAGVRYAARKRLKGK